MIAMYKTDDRIIREIEAYEPGAWINLTAPTLEECADISEQFGMDIADVRAALDDEEKQMFLEELGVEESGLDRLIKCSYALLGLISFLTGKSISGMKSAAQGINSVGSAAGSTAKKTKDAGKEAKKAAGELAAFDELNVLNKQQEEDTDDDTGGGGGGAGSGLAYDFEQAQNPLKDLMGRLSNFWDAFLARLAPSVAAWKAAWE